MLKEIGSVLAGAVLDEALGNDKDADAQRQQNYEAQKEFAQNGIRWRVADAQAAGLHPLFALGGAGAAYSPNPVTIGDSSHGQNLTNALQRQQTEQERQMGQAQLKVLEAQANRDQAQAFYYASEAARSSQSGGSSAPFPSVVGPTVPGMVGHVTPKAPDAISSRFGDKAQTAAINPAWETHIWNDDGTMIDLLRSDEGPAESAENPMLWPAIVARNVEKYGPEWLGDVVMGKRRNESVRSPITNFIEWVSKIGSRQGRANWDDHTYPAGRYYRPEGPGWSSYHNRFRR